MRVILVLLVVCFFNLGCCVVKCDLETPILQFRLLSKSDSTNLIFGLNKKFDYGKISIYCINNSNKSDTTRISKFNYPDYYRNVASDSIIMLSIFKENIKVYIDYDNTHIDSLSINYNSVSSRCCGTSSWINELKYNTMLINKDSNYVYTFYK